MFTIDVDTRTITARLSVMPDRVRQLIVQKTYELVEKLKSGVQGNLTNHLLNIRTGNLVRSIFTDVQNSTNAVTGRVYSAGVAYAAIQEFGGHTKAHIIEAVNAKALYFNGRFATRVNHPGSNIKGVRYMGAAFDAMKPEIQQGYEQAVSGGLKA